MQPKLRISTVGQTAGVFLSVSFVLCVVFDLIAPQFAMFEMWQGFLPGFKWLSPGSFVLGLVESYAWGWYIALIWVPAYNFFSRRAAERAALKG